MEHIWVLFEGIYSDRCEVAAFKSEAEAEAVRSDLMEGPGRHDHWDVQPVPLYRERPRVVTLYKRNWYTESRDFKKYGDSTPDVRAERMIDPGGLPECELLNRSIQGTDKAQVTATAWPQYPLV